ncbi:hypothetical protein ETW23_22025 (plasmid) [Leisingera sp. NJS201]|uniref:hypothetical protein n=1 Tax=Leisingera sp. NJS201 TaxID=2508306 RepID=UPI001070E88F|nr:hypothetical protein [Leisingera sp. NJS201]QBR38583.1 hypothetical protein ETW23_22025 [Leisingera sp. NJS201]
MPPVFTLQKVLCGAVILPMAAWRRLRGKYDPATAAEEAALVAPALKPFFRVPYTCGVVSPIPGQMNGKFTCCRTLQNRVRLEFRFRAYARKPARFMTERIEPVPAAG